MKIAADDIAASRVMKYISTRGRAPAVDFDQAVVSGLAPDGGLYVPEAWPQFSREEIAAMKDAPFAAVAARLLAAFAGLAPDDDAFLPLTEEAFATFDHPDVAPVKEIGEGAYLLELFHGPTLAFKDVAMQALARLYDRVLTKTGGRKTILGATSGDTGGAAIDAFADRETTELFILHPKGRISEVQRRIMTVNPAANIHNIAVEGSFDDCQRIVKTLFGDRDLNAALDLGGVNSINWVRLAVQTVYYFTTALRLGAPDRAASYVVPTGNFGDVFAGYAAKRMGLPVGRLAVAVNENDIMHRALSTGLYEPREVRPTNAPSMDIQVASNFERLMFETLDRDAFALTALMSDLADGGAMTLPAPMMAEISRDFVSERADGAEFEAKIRETHEKTGELVDPHTAIGLVAADKLRVQGALDTPIVTLATAHPAKFPDAVEAAAGTRPTLPARYADLHEREERMVDAPADPRAIAEIVLSGSAFRQGA